MAAFRVKLVLLVKPGPARRRHIYLAADDGLDPLGLAGPVKVNRAVHHAMVGDGAGSLAHVLYHLREIPDPACAVQKAVFRMNM